MVIKKQKRFCCWLDLNCEADQGLPYCPYICIHTFYSHKGNVQEQQFAASKGNSFDKEKIHYGNGCKGPLTLCQQEVILLDLPFSLYNDFGTTFLYL